MKNADIMLGKAFYYEFFSYAFFFCDDKKGFENFLAQAGELAKSPLSDNADFASILNASFESFKAEQNAVLFDFSYANVPLSASFYDEGRDSGKKRLAMIELIKRTKYRPNLAKLSESEDFVGFLFLFMAQVLRDGANGDENAASVAKDIFSEILNSFVDEFCELLASHKDSVIFKALAGLIEGIAQIERDSYGLKAPAKVANSTAKQAMAMRPHVSKMPTAKSKLNWDEFTAL